jgi:excinuclease ABC subunit C
MEEKLKRLPMKPGVYTFRNAKNRILYAGKAKDLRKRLKSYFRKSAHLDARKTSMMKEVNDFDYLVTDSELEALVLEASLIKQHRPKFNIILRDDKNYPYLKLTVNEQWPRLEVVRRIQKDGALYFGPYVPAGSMWETLAFIRRNFQLRNCKHQLDRPVRPCISFQMGRCPAPCSGFISSPEYMQIVDEVRRFLKGEKKELIEVLEKKMHGLSGTMEYEEAARVRDRIKTIERALESQKVIAPELGDIDVIGFYRQERSAAFVVFFVRNGVMIGSGNLFLKNTGDVSDGELMSSFIMQFYSKDVLPPSEILSPALPENPEMLMEWLGRRKGSGVKILSLKTGKRRELVDMATANAVLSCRDNRETITEELLDDIRERLNLERRPEDIGAFDVSTISGNESVGAFIFWKEGEFRKDKYRKLKIRTVDGVNDFAMMEELVERISDNLQGDIPDLILIDGGEGHLGVAQKVMKKKRDLFSQKPMLAGIAKDPDRVFLPGSDMPVNLEDGRKSSLLLKRIRDEAHRFAISYHQKLRGKGLMESPLEKIRGIGRKRRLALLRQYGSIKNIRKAGIEEIAAMKGFNRKVAENLINQVHKNG